LRLAAASRRSIFSLITFGINPLFNFAHLPEFKMPKCGGAGALIEVRADEVPGAAGTHSQARRFYDSRV
jgi:hypothetical protein